MRVLLRATRTVPTRGTSDRPIDFHRLLPDYRVSPLASAPRLAKRLGVARVFVKNETARFGLPSFKVLGASWATYASLRDQLGPLPARTLSYHDLRDWAAPARPLTLLAATDGNHGRAVARVARWLGLSARIFVPSFVSAERRAAIESEGAQLVVIDGVYDASVDAALHESARARTLLVTDTARSASDTMPKLVTDGYSTCFAEVDQQLEGLGVRRPLDAVSVQAGVGGLASAATSWAGSRPQTRVIVVEPENAACVMAGLAAGEPIEVSAKEVSAMSCLQCGTISLTAFDTLDAGVSCCLAVEDSWAFDARRELARAGIDAGASGAAGVAGLLAAFGGDLVRPIKDYLGISARTRLLVVATESSLASARQAGETAVAA